MSFMKSLKGLTDGLKDLIGDNDTDKQKDSHGQTSGYGEANRGASDSYYKQQQPSQHHFDPHQQQYGQSPYPPQQHQNGGLPTSHSYGGPPPGGPQLPPGWIQHWDPNSQRYYYLEQATGRSQWEPPVMSPPPGDQQRAFGGLPPGQGYPPGQYSYNQGYGPQEHGYPPPVSAAHPGGEKYPSEAVKGGDKKNSNKGVILAAGAGGLVVGGLAGAALAGDSSDDESHARAASAAYGAPPAGYAVPSYEYGAPPPGDPRALEHNSDVSSSQRESLEEARHDYEEAQRQAADSDASSSDQEELEEATEKYQEEIEEAEEEAYD